MELMTTTREMPAYINKELRKATEKVFKIGETVRKCAFETAFIMAKVDETECYKDDGFNNVYEWAMQTFGFKKSASYTLLRVGKEIEKVIKTYTNPETEVEEPETEVEEQKDIVTVYEIPRDVLKQYKVKS